MADNNCCHNNDNKLITESIDENVNKSEDQNNYKREESDAQRIAVNEENEVKDNDSEDNETNVITMIDVLEEEQDLEDNAFAVLANSDDNHCTYLKGYVSRQALYACNTCQLSEGQSAGICLACSYHCHDGHNLFELYTKRNFRCDCGNDKFVDNKCKLYSKTSMNDKNEYNHNFKGTYCTCERPYPDPDNDVDDQMIQCIACEDWFHGRHLGVLPENEDFAEMICISCVRRLPFLWLYYCAYGRKISVENAENNEDLDITSLNSSEECRPDTEAVESAKSGSTVIPPVCRVMSESDSGIENSSDSSVTTMTCKLSLLKLTQTQEQQKELSTTYWPLSWRSNLCKCADCMTLYATNECLFLINEKDMVHYYENEGKESNTKVSHYDKGISELNKMDRFQQIEYMSGFNDLKDELKDYLKKFVDSNKVVRKEDIIEFFENMESRKRQRVDIQYNCK